MESFERPPRSVPSDGFTIASASSGIQSGNTLRGNCCRGTISSDDISFAAHARRADKFSY